MNVLMIGCGKMGGALLSRWIRLDDYQITVVDPALTSAPEGVRLVTQIEALDQQRFDAIVIAIKPQLIPQVLPAYQAHLNEGGCFISMAAGYSIRSLEKLMGTQAFVRIMPNLPAQVGHGVTAVYANQACSAEHVAQVRALTDAAGHTLVVDDEDAIDRVTAVAGSGPGYAFELARCWVEAAEKLGFTPSEARSLVLNTLIGSMELALRSDQSLEALRDSVTSKNGTTQAGLDVLMADSTINKLFHATIQAAYDRAVELR